LQVTFVSLFLFFLLSSVTFPGYGERSFLTYESNILFAMRFMVDTGMVGGGWVELPAGQFRKVPAPGVSHCQIEVDVAYTKLRCFGLEEKSDIAPLRVLSFDIECAGRKGVFPEPKHDPVIMIACYVTRQGESSPFIRNIFTVRGCSNIIGAEVFSFPTEQEMLSAWRAFVVAADPDVLTGYNINNFDLPYLIHRAEALKLNGFLFLGRIKV
jgi:DNA polymerase delta subunit 1